MTEFKIASLAHAALSAWSTFAYAVVSLIVGLAQCLLIWWGIRKMAENSEARDRDRERRHKEAMTALEELIRRTGLRPETGQAD